MPMLHTLGNVDNYTRMECDRSLAPFLIPATATDADEYLTGTVMHVPVVTASRLKGDVMHAANPR